MLESLLWGNEEQLMAARILLNGEEIQERNVKMRQAIDLTPEEMAKYRRG